MNSCYRHIAKWLTIGFLIGIKIAFGQNAIESKPSISLENQFQALELDEQQLIAFEERGLQKISDWMEYEVLMLSDTVEKKWRAYISKKLSELFHSDSLQIKASEILRVMTSNEQTPYQFEMQDAFHRIGQDYFGQATISILSRNGAQTHNLSVELILSKKAKDFGGEKLWLWEVLIGEVRAD